MIKTRPDSVFEVWDGAYVNQDTSREDRDKNVEVVQIEPGSFDSDYIVEIVREAKK